ncbi:hypothetical protein [Desulfospira joergensenii]|uniref:hypothetical protein n=1 Tax=Desulfospira joergensenii TaxID=53329 RepID=UPI0003B38F29|nr:hypothetical protein [Desulfospira joergensenii]
MNIQGIGQAFTAYQSTGVQRSSESSGFDVESIIAEEDSNPDGYLRLNQRR